MKKVLFVATVVGFIASFEMNDMAILEKMGYEVHFACDGNIPASEEKKKKLIDRFPNFHQISFSRNPMNFRNFRAYKELVRLIKKEEFDIVHCHTPVGGVLARRAAKRCFVRKIVYTAHGFHFFKGAPLINWLFYYNIEKSLSNKTDVLITINSEDYELAKNKFKANCIKRIHGVGIEIDRFVTPSIDKETKRLKLGVKSDEKLLLSVGELSKDKNHLESISAMKILGKKGYKLFIAGEGKCRRILEKYIKENGLDNCVSLLGYRNDINELLYASDAFVFPSFFEGLSVALMEAIAAHKPVACSKVRGNVDLIVTPESYFNPKSVDSMVEAIEKIFSMPDEELLRVVETNFNNLKQYDRENVNKEMTTIYESIV